MNVFESLDEEGFTVSSTPETEWYGRRFYCYRPSLLNRAKLFLRRIPLISHLVGRPVPFNPDYTIVKKAED